MDAEHKAAWYEGVELPRYGELDRNVRCRAAVVGAGITGLTAAMSLALAGAETVVIDMGHVGWGTTGHSTGHLDSYYDGGYRRLLCRFGKEAAGRLIRAKRAAIDHIGMWVSEFGIDCDFVRVPGYLYSERQKDRTAEDEHEAAVEMDTAAELVEPAPLSLVSGSALRLEGQGRFSPLKYVAGLARAFVERGGSIYESTRMHDLEDLHGLVRVRAGGYTVVAERLILAGHTSLVGKMTIQPRIYPMQSFVIAAEVGEQIKDALYWDTESPYHYTRILSSDRPRTLIIGGADRHTGSGGDMRQSFRELDEYARRRYSVERITHRWSHEFFEPADGVPYAGRAPRTDNVYTAAAFSGDGLTLGTVSGLLAADLVLERENALAKILSPERVKPLASAGRVGKTLTGTLKHFVGDRLASYGDSAEDIEAGSGALIREQGKLYAVYKDAAGEVEVLSPVCRHMGCIVQWNNAAETWDCPCHGGRYDKHGNVIMGPPREPLEKAELPVAAEV